MEGMHTRKGFSKSAEGNLLHNCLGTNDQIIENVKDLFRSNHETPQPQDNIETPKRRTIVINEIGNNIDEIYDLHRCMQSLATEMEAMKLFLK